MRLSPGKTALSFGFSAFILAGMSAVLVGVSVPTALFRSFVALGIFGAIGYIVGLLFHR